MPTGRENSTGGVARSEKILVGRLPAGHGGEEAHIHHGQRFSADPGAPICQGLLHSIQPGKYIIQRTLIRLLCAGESTAIHPVVDVVLKPFGPGLDG